MEDAASRVYLIVVAEQPRRACFSASPSISLIAEYLTVVYTYLLVSSAYLAKQISFNLMNFLFSTNLATEYLRVVCAELTRTFLIYDMVLFLNRICEGDNRPKKLFKKLFASFELH